jgi:hypothetical protein
LMLFLGILPASAPLEAQFATLPVNLTYLSQRADIIVRGRVVGVGRESLAGHPNIPTIRVTLEVENMLRGPSGRIYTFRELSVDRRTVSAKNGYQVGQRLLLFLPSPSEYGLSSPIGIEQGRFHILRSSDGSETAVNETGNAGLFKNVDISSYNLGTKNIRGLKEDGRAAQGVGPVRLDSLISLVKTLTLLPRIR